MLPIRRYRPDQPEDRAGCYAVCVRTAAAGDDARGLYSTDDLMPDLFCGPYLELEPDWAFVAVSGDRVVGYLVATPDTRSFVRRYRTDWLPGFAVKYPLPTTTDDAGAGPAAGTESGGERALIRSGHDPERMVIDEVDRFPAHLHIDLLPEAQGQGLGRHLIDTLCTELADHGVLGVHLGMDPANAGAREFYLRLGFADLPSGTSVSPVLGRDLAAVAE